MLANLDRDRYQELRPRLQELYEAAYRLLPQYSYHDPDEVRAYLDWLYEGDPSGFFVALADRAAPPVVGFIAVHGTWHERSGRLVAEVHELVVDPKWQGKGIAGALISRALHYARELGRQVVALWVGQQNRRAEALYRRLGFQRTGQWGRWVRMELAIAPSSDAGAITNPRLD